MFKSFFLGLAFSVLSQAALTQAVMADTIVLVQGYQGSAASWRATGVTQVLSRNHWQDGGHYSARGSQVVHWENATKSKNRFITIDLPTETPITFQAQFLGAYVEQIIKRYPKDKLHLVGHSAGGVVARAFMVRYPMMKVQTLITIASPHLGTDKAETGLQVANSPLSWFTPMVGAGTINRSRGLYAQLVRERPNNYLGWLNHQKHPKARYVSIIRAVSDGWVPAWSQDMNSVGALRGQSETYPVSGRHDLNVYDGLTILNILAKNKK